MQSFPADLSEPEGSLAFDSLAATPAGNTLTAISTIARQEGIRALYKGVLLTWVKQAPQYAVTFCCYDLAKTWLASDGKSAKVEA